jgi:hypothetical protein
MFEFVDISDRMFRGGRKRESAISACEARGLARVIDAAGYAA